MLLSCAVFAQDTEIPAIPGNIVEPPPVALPPGVNPQPEAAVEPVNLANLGDTLIVEAIDQPKLSGNDLAALYRKYTGHRVIVSSAASAAEFAFVQPASPQDPLTYAQAAELLKKAATIENFIFVPDGTDPTLEYLTLPTAGIKPTGIGVGVFNENDVLPEGDAVISYVMNLSYIKPDEAVRTFTQIIGQFGAFGSIAAVPNAASVVITENTSLIRKLIDLKAEIDKPSSQVATRFIDVKYADVTELATTLNELLGAQQGSSNTAGVQRQQAQPANNPGLPTDGAIPGATSSGEETPVQIIPDARTNRIFAMGRPVDLLFVEGLVREFDTESDQRNFLRRKLKFLAVSDFLPIAGDALTRAFSGTGTGDATGQPAAQGGAGGNNNRDNRQQTNNNSNLFNGGGQSGGNTGGAAGGSSGSRGSSLSDPEVNSAPESLLIGRTLLVADNITNSVVIQGPPTAIEIIENLLDQVDVKADQVMISTIIGQLSKGKNRDLGIDILSRGSRFGARGGAGNAPAIPLDPLTPFVPGSLTGGGLSVFGRFGNDINVYLNALQSKTDFTVLSRPSIFTTNNRKGVISSGERVAIPTNSNSFGTGGQSTNIEYRDVVLQFEVIPLVNSENEITLQIAILNDELGDDQVLAGAGPNGTNLTVPRIITRELVTTITVNNNETIVLGGLISTRDTKTISGIPILSDIPGLGRLFSREEIEKSNSELLIFIQTSIVNGDRTSDFVQTDFDERYNVSDDARNFADGSVLPPLEPVMEKGGSPIPAAVPVEGDRQNFNRKSIRPIHRR